MKAILRNILLISLLSLLVRCDKDEVTSRNYPRLKTLPVSEITAEGARFNAEIILRGDFEVINYGFVWSESENPTKENSDRVIYSENIQSENFYDIIETTLKERISYFVRAFVETSDYIVYGENVRFLSLGSNGSELIDFSPKSGHLEDTIRIHGTNFGRIKSNVEVKIDQINVEIVDFKETEITVLVPNSLSSEKSTISVLVSGNITSFDKEFTLLKPVITNLAPISVTFGSLVEIEGANFNSEPNKISITFIGQDGLVFPAEVVSVSESRLETRVPLNIASKQSKISISMNNFDVVSNQIITIQDPTINSFTPQLGRTLTEITIEGENFSTIISNNTVKVDGYTAEIIRADNNELIVIVPDQTNHIYSSRQVQISVEVFSSEIQTNDKFTITDKWFRIDDLPFDGYAWKGMTINNKGYVLFPGGLWKYDNESNHWIKRTAFPDITRSGPGIFSISDKIYLGAGSNSTSNNNKDFWAYDIFTDTWSQKDDFPGEPRKWPLAFTIGTNGYLGVGLESKSSSCCSGYNDVWKYNTLNDNWIQVANHPASEDRGMWRIVSTKLNNEIYAGLGTSATQGSISDEIYKYNAVSDQWIKISDYPIQGNHIDGVAFTINNQAFFGSGAYPDELWSYDGSSWTSQDSHPAGRNGGFSFVIENIGYFGGGSVGNQFWLFDISQPD